MEILGYMLAVLQDFCLNDFIILIFRFLHPTFFDFGLIRVY